MNRDDSILKLRRFVAQALGRSVEDIPAESRLSELNQEPLFDEQDLFDFIETELGLAPEVLWDGLSQPEPNRRIPRRLVARSLQLLAPFDPHAVTLFAEHARRWDDPTLQSLAASAQAGRYVPSGIVTVEDIRLISPAGVCLIILGKFAAVVGFLPLLAVITCDFSMAESVRLLPVAALLGLIAPAVDLLPGLWAIRSRRGRDRGVSGV